MSELDNLSDPEVLECVFVDVDLMGELAEDAPDVLDALSEDNLDYEPTFLDDIVSDYVDAYPEEKHELAELGIIRMVPDYDALEVYTYPDEQLAVRRRRSVFSNTMTHKGRNLHRIKFARKKDYVIPHVGGFKFSGRMWEHRSTKDVYAEFVAHIKRKPNPKKKYKKEGRRRISRCGLWYRRCRSDPAFVIRAARIIAREYSRYRPSAQRKLIKYARGGAPPVQGRKPMLMRQGREVGFSKLGFETLCDNVV